MPISQNLAELRRLISLFAAEADKFLPLTLSTFYVTQQGASSTRSFAKTNHAVMLWQYYGAVGSDGDAERLAANVLGSELQWGVRGADLSRFAILEGDGCEFFVRMAQRAGSLFDGEESKAIQAKVVEEVVAAEQSRHKTAKPVSITNQNPLAVWINYLLYHLSLTNPGREHAERVEPDPFTLSLLALERLLAEQAIGKVDRSVRPITDLHFQVAVSFPGEHRPYVLSVVNALRPSLGTDEIFYDHDFQAQLARPNVDIVLQDIYRKRSALVVVFLCKEYAQKQWCGLEWRAIRDIIKNRNDDQIMFVRFDDEPVEGLFSIDGYLDARTYSPENVAEFVLTRLNTQK